MRPRFYPSLVNDRFGDPALFVDFLMERRAILFDLGDISALSPRAVLRLSDVFVSHTHIDHFIGFDHLLRLLVGREKRLRLYGPPGFIDRVAAKLDAYTWNLAGSFRTELSLIVTEVHAVGRAYRATFRLRNRFQREQEEEEALRDGTVLDEPSVAVRCTELEHRTPCLAFAIEEPEHVNVWRIRVAERGLAVGPWLAGLKSAIFRKLPDETPVEAQLASGVAVTLPLGALRDVVSITPGQKIAYVTDAANCPENRARIVDLARNADILFIESVFADAEAARAAERAHLTTRQAGELAGLARAARVEPFHFSPRYAGRERLLLDEVRLAFRTACDRNVGAPYPAPRNALPPG